MINHRRFKLLFFIFVRDCAFCHDCHCDTVSLDLGDFYVKAAVFTGEGFAVFRDSARYAAYESVEGVVIVGRKLHGQHFFNVFQLGVSCNSEFIV